jgi:hypothetical protein
MIQISWQKCQGNSWCSFLNVDLSHSHFNNLEGVYIIFRTDGHVIRVGQGIIKDRLAAHRNDSKITTCGNLLVTWAEVQRSYRDGVERYLAEVLKPTVGDAFPDVVPIPVNLP